MSLTLILTRHAKSSWDDPRLDDFDRPLNGRGRSSARAIGAWLAERKLVPGEVIVSGARRTVETWEQMSPEMPERADMRSEPLLYHANATAMLGVLRSASAPIVTLASLRGQIALVPQETILFSDTIEANIAFARPDATREEILEAARAAHVAEFAERLVAEPPGHPRFYDYPTCATTVMQLPAMKWADATWQSAQVVDFVIPRELA